MRLARIVVVVLTLALALPAGLNGQTLAPARTAKLATAILGRPLVSGAYVFFVQRDARGDNVLSAYNSVDGTTRMLVRGAFEIVSPSSDGTQLAWIERGAASSRVQLLQLADHRQRTLLSGPAAERIAELALSGDTLLYTAAGAENGVFAFDLAESKNQGSKEPKNRSTENGGVVRVRRPQASQAGAVRRLAERGSGLVAGGGNLVWSAEHIDAHGSSEWRLFLDRLDGAAPKIVARSPAPFGGYDVDHEHVLWSALPPAAERRVWMYSIVRGTSEPISAVAARFAQLDGGQASWTAQAGSTGVALERFDLGARRRSSLRFDPARSVASWGTLPNGRIVWSDEAANERTLQLSTLPRSATTQAGATNDELRPARSLCGTPLTCGQLRTNGQYLVDAGGRWDVRGVQFFLPQQGINSWTFYDNNYWPALAEVDTWLDIARNSLRARLLRIFVELPDGAWQPTSFETVYDFAQRAGQRGMRLGIVVQNSADFRMTPERRAWIDGLLSYFGARGATPLIGYLSAANEINNWCPRQDCFDRDAAYADAAIAWTAEVAATVEARASGVLVTVGMSSEVNDSDGLPAVYNFFRRDAAGRSLAGTVDFLSPHNYAGGAYGVYNDLRYTYAYGGPILLEEFGWTTDPQSDDPRFTEGVPVCVNDPWSMLCQNTGPYFIEVSLRAQREVPYAGGAAWMLADIARKNCDRDPSDLWSGLFAAGEGYCGGTRNIVPGQPKATAARVALFYGADDLSRLTYLPLN